jgi:hypothetical protein
MYQLSWFIHNKIKYAHLYDEYLYFMAFYQKCKK